MVGSGKPKRSQTKPHFRFYPGAYADGGPFELSDTACEACDQPCTWRYTGGVLALLPPQNICAGCIAAGNLDKLLDNRRYQLADIDIEDETVSETLAQELLNRTPGVASFNPFVWPCMDNIPMAYVGTGDDQVLASDPAAIEATRVAFAAIGWDDNGPSPYALIFRELDGERLRAVIDLD